jgi:hypothetical protein
MEDFRRKYKYTVHGIPSKLQLANGISGFLNGFKINIKFGPFLIPKIKIFEVKSHRSYSKFLNFYSKNVRNGSKVA